MPLTNMNGKDINAIVAYIRSLSPPSQCAVKLWQSSRRWSGPGLASKTWVLMRTRRGENSGAQRNQSNIHAGQLASPGINLKEEGARK